MKSAGNVLFLMADEHQAAALSCVGHPLVKTPNLDRLAARGVLFDNAYTPSPICVPARAAVATGQYVHQCRYWDNATAYDGRVRGWGHRLQDAGIAVTSIGKLHYRLESDPTGFDRQIRPMHIADGIGQVWGAVRNPLPETPWQVPMINGLGAGLSAYNQYDIRVAEDAVKWLHDAGSHDAPWTLFCSFVAPHFPLIVPREFLDLYDPANMPLPALRPEDGHELHPWVARMSRFMDNDREFATDDQRRLAIAAYFALCSFVDAQIGKVLDALEASGQMDDTLIIYASDHGEALGKRGRWGKSVLYGESVRVPLILAGPGVAAGQRVATPVSLLDIAPTICAFHGVAPDAVWPGQSLLDIVAASEDPGRMVFSEYHAVGSPSGGFMVANAHWAYHHYVGYPPELFDLGADPSEVRNLATDPACAEVLTRMDAALRSICDPDAVDAAAKADQDRLVADFGGPDAALQTGPGGASPVPV